MKKRITRNNNTFQQTCLYTLLLLLVYLCPNLLSAQQKQLLIKETHQLDDNQGQVEVSIYNNAYTSVKSTSSESANSSSLLTNCNTDSEIIATIYSTGENLNEVGCHPDDSLEICFKVYNFNSGTGTNNCQYLHGLVPDFNDYYCIEPLDMSPDGEPGFYTVPFTNHSNTGTWQWFPDGVTLYNDIPNGYLPPFTPVGAGWFYINRPGNDPDCLDYNDPNCTWGDGFGCDDNNGLQWEVCFLAKLNCPAPGPITCDFSFRTFGDGETGGWNQAGCENDQSWYYSFIGQCCEQPIITINQSAYEVCGGENFTLPLTSNMDPETTYEWQVSPGTYGATAGTGNVISDYLFNNTGAPVTETYYITPTCAQGCVGEVFIVTVTINPGVFVYIDEYEISCDFVELVANTPYSSGFLSYQWSTGEVTPTIYAVGPGYHSVEIFNEYGCSGFADAFISSNPNNIEASIIAPFGTEVCQGDPIQLNAIVSSLYTGPYSYTWSTGSTSNTIVPTTSGTYWVNVGGACNQDLAVINVVINPKPSASIILSDNSICQGECIDIAVLTNGSSYASCLWNNGFQEPSFTACPTLNNNYYQVTVTGVNGCTATASATVDVAWPLSPPAITCIATANSIEFSWPPVPGAFAYNVNGVLQVNTSIVFSNLNPNETINITVESMSASACPGGISQATCTTTSCLDIPILITAPSFVCQDNPLVELQANEPGGLWYGSGIIDPLLGLFDPAAANPGNNTIIYVLSIGNCEYTGTFDIQVEAVLETPQIVCNTTVNSVSFSWAPVAGASSYLVNGIAQSNTTYELNNLLPNQAVSIMVEAINNGACGNSMALSICNADPCPATNLVLTQTETLCEDGPAIVLEANLPGAVWSGAGVVNVTGLFHPAFANLGLNNIICTATDGNCTYSESMNVNVEAALAAPNIICNSTVNSVSFNWAPVLGATNYLVNGIAQSNTSYQYNNLLPNQSVSITVEAVGNGACGSTFAQSSCIAEDCPAVNLVLTPTATLCQDGATIVLQANTPGALWSGSGIVNASGVFDPASANVGQNSVLCTVSNGNCTYSESMNVNVEATLATPDIICNSTVNTVSFNWAPVVGATSYLVNGIAQNGTSYQYNNLLPNQSVSITVEAVGNGVCGSTFAQSSCIAEDCPAVNLVLTPTATLCQDGATIVLQANAPGALWSGSGIVNASGVFDPASASVGQNSVLCTVSNGNCTYSESMNVNVEAALAIPNIVCNSTVNSVSFNWAPVAGATNYLVNGIAQSGTSYQYNNLLPNQSVSITVEAVGNGACGSTFAQSACIAEDCPAVNLVLTPTATLCQDGVTIVLQANTAGAVWSGSGIVNASGVFDPASANVGQNSVLCTVSNGNCTYSESMNVNVEAALAIPDIVCNSTVNSVSFNWAPVVGATNYLVNGIAQNGTSYQYSNLLPNQSVSITVEAVGNGACGSTFAQSTCIAEDCPAVNLVLTPTATLCQDGVTIVLQANTPGAIWSGSGIVNASGVFDPASANVGQNSVLCTVSNGNCSYSSSMNINVEAVLATPNIVCNSTVNSVSFNWTPVSGATSYLVNGIAQSGTSYQYNNLLPNQSVSVTVEAVSNGACGNTMAQASCTANDCGLVSIILTPVEKVCDADQTTGLIALTATVSGTNVAGIWSGTGVVDPVNGWFDPTASDVLPGANDISYVIADGFCSFSASMVVEVYEAMATDIIQLGALDCNSNLPILMSAAEAGVSYLWTTPSGIQLEATQLEATTAGSYSLLLTNTLSGCTASAEISVTENNTLPQVEAGETQEFACLDESKTLSGFASAEADVLYWKDEAGNILPSTLLTNNQLIADITSPGLYTLYALNSATGCSQEDQVLISQNENVPQAITVEIEAATCFEEQDAYIEILEVSGGTAPYSYSLDDAAFGINAMFPYLPAGMHVLRVQDAVGCSYEESVLIPETQPILLDIGQDMTLTLGESHQIHLFSNLPMSEVDTVLWSATESISCMDPACMEVLLKPMNTTDVKVVLLQKTGCAAEASIRLQVDKPRDVFIPNVFSPNGDGNNDYFYLQGNPEVLRINSMKIFNRWGELVFGGQQATLNQAETGWDGRLDGEPLNPGVFVYLVEVIYVDGVVMSYSGDVTLLR